MIEYDSDAQELERMMATVDGGSNPEKGDGAEQKAPSNVIGQTESCDPTSQIEVLGEAVLLKDTSDVEVLGDAVPPEDTSRSVPLTKKPVYSEWQESAR